MTYNSKDVNTIDFKITKIDYAINLKLVTHYVYENTSNKHNQQWDN